MIFPNLKEEKKLWKKGYKRVVGLDEAGRGCLAGPVVAAAVVINKARKSYKAGSTSGPPAEIKDSKKLSSKKREEFYKILTNNSLIEWGTARVSEKVIDKINILEATKLAMKRAIEKLSSKLQIPNYKQIQNSKSFDQKICLLIDGNFKLDFPIPQKSIIKADEKVFSCAAASIIAKVVRDKTMKRYAKKFPEYGFDRHKGYATKFHKKMIKKYKPCKIHRKTFKPVKLAI